jgi:NAD(P)H-dependent flavin oxidoreductase YrpB (nitropropane dioxygenase family)
LLASPECEHTEQARTRIVQAQETDTLLTRAFDVAQGLAWPPQYPGRALRNRFTDEWYAHIDALQEANEARQQLAEAIANKNYDLAYIYAGEAVGLVTRQQSAADVEWRSLLLPERQPRHAHVQGLVRRSVLGRYGRDQVDGRSALDRRQENFPEQ